VDGLAGDWLVVGNFLDEIEVYPTVNGSYYQVRDGEIIVGSVFMTDITGMTFNYINQQMVYYNDAEIDNLVMVSPSNIETLDDRINHSITIVGALDDSDRCYDEVYGFGNGCPVTDHFLTTVIYEDGITEILAQDDWDTPSISTVILPNTVQILSDSTSGNEFGSFAYWYPCFLGVRWFDKYYNPGNC
jgi:hypothetical protein